MISVYNLIAGYDMNMSISLSVRLQLQNKWWMWFLRLHAFVFNLHVRPADTKTEEKGRMRLRYELSFVTLEIIFGVCYRTLECSFYLETLGIVCFPYWIAYLSNIISVALIQNAVLFWPHKIVSLLITFAEHAGFWNIAERDSIVNHTDLLLRTHNPNVETTCSGRGIL